MASIQLSIADPCHEDWNQMLPEEKGRFCLSCQKTVVDFTGMSDRQVFDYFKNYKGTTCGQFTPEQLNRDITKPATHSIGRWKYFWQILLPAVFTFYKGEAQTLRGKVAPKIVCKTDTTNPQRIMMGAVATLSEPRPLTYQLQGTVVNENQEPVPFATVVSESGKQLAADSMGHFMIEMQADKKITISSVGYETQSLSYDSIVLKAIEKGRISKSKGIVPIDMEIELKQAETNLDEVVIKGEGAVRYSTMVAGGITMVRGETIFSKTETVKPVATSPSIKIFPNPIAPGQSFQISLQIKETGSYLLRITDAAGRIALEEKLNITGKEQTEIISGNSLQQAGIYFINITSQESRKDKGLSGKIVVR